MIISNLLLAVSKKFACTNPTLAYYQSLLNTALRFGLSLIGSFFLWKLLCSNRTKTKEGLIPFLKRLLLTLFEMLPIVLENTEFQRNRGRKKESKKFQI